MPIKNSEFENDILEALSKHQNIIESHQRHIVDLTQSIIDLSQAMSRLVDIVQDHKDTFQVKVNKISENLHDINLERIQADSPNVHKLVYPVSKVELEGEATDDIS